MPGFTVAPTRPGRPSKVDAAGRATRERLLVAAAESCAEFGFEGVTLGDVARRAGVAAPSIYNHFSGKVELLAAAARDALDRLPPPADRMRAAAVARQLLAPEFAATRRLLLELHLAAHRHPDVARHVEAWRDQQAAAWRPLAAPEDPEAALTTFFSLTLGLCLIDSFTGIGATPERVGETASRLIESLFPDPSPPKRPHSRRKAAP